MRGIERTGMPPFPPAGMRTLDQLLRQLGGRDPDVGGQAGILAGVLSPQSCLAYIRDDLDRIPHHVPPSIVTEQVSA
jgi:hypothetical protein